MRTPLDVREKGCVKSVHAEQYVTAVGSRNQRGIKMLQRCGCATQMPGIELRAVGADDQHRFPRTGNTLRGSRHPRPQIALTLIRPCNACRYGERLPQG